MREPWCKVLVIAIGAFLLLSIVLQVVIATTLR